MEPFRTADFASARAFSLAGFGTGLGLASGLTLIASGRQRKNRRRFGAGIALTFLSGSVGGAMALLISLKGMSH